MITVNGTIVNVAIPSIQDALRFSDTSLVWVIGAYLGPFGGLLLLAARLGDLFGRRRVILSGIALFTLASLGGGLAGWRAALVAARAAQGVGGALISAVGLVLMMDLFDEPIARARAVGFYVLASACGGSLGMLLGGTLTSVLGWRWVFLIHAPLGAAVYALCWARLPREPAHATRERLDVFGALTLTVSVMLAIYAVIGSTRAAQSATQTLSLLAIAASLMSLCVWIERRAVAPLVPPRLLYTKMFGVANGAAALFAGAALAWNFFSTLYLGRVLHFAPLRIGLLFLPAQIAMATVSVLVSPWLVVRLGSLRALMLGLSIAATGLATIAHASAQTTLTIDLGIGMLVVGLGAGVAYTPLYLTALGNVSPRDSGAASGIVSTSFIAGGALALAALSSIAEARTRQLLALGAHPIVALEAGYQVALSAGAALAILAAILCSYTLSSEPKMDSAGTVR